MPLVNPYLVTGKLTREVLMTTYLFLAKGASVGTARVVAVSADREIVRRFIDALVREEEPEGDRPQAVGHGLQVVRDGDE